MQRFARVYIYIHSLNLNPTSILTECTYNFRATCEFFYSTLKLSSIDCEMNVRELDELSGSPYVCRLRVTEKVYVVLCDTTLRSATCNSRSTSSVADITRWHTMTADWTMYVCMYGRRWGIHAHVKHVRAIIYRNAFAWPNCCYRKLISRHRDILSFERQRFREYWKANLQD